MRYTLKQLQVFLAVAQHQSVSAAAVELAMSQSAVSGALNVLESQFDIQLFDRKGKRLRINERGRSVRAKAEALVAQAIELEASLRGQEGVGKLRVGATLTIGNYLCVGLIDEFMTAFPQCRVHLDVANTESIVQEILDFKIDVGMIEGELRHPDLQIDPWQEDELVCFCAPDHPLAGQSEVSLSQLLQLKWILREQGSGTRQTFDRAMKEYFHKLDVVLELQHTEAIKRSVEAGLGVGCLSRITLQEAFARGSLVALETADLELTRTLYLVLHRHKYQSTAVQQWLNTCAAIKLP